MKKVILGISVLVVLSLIVISGLVFNKNQTMSTRSSINNTNNTANPGTYKISFPGSYINMFVIDKITDENSTFEFGEQL